MEKEYVSISSLPDKMQKEIRAEVLKQAKEMTACRCRRCGKTYEIMTVCIRDNSSACPYCIGVGVTI